MNTKISSLYLEKINELADLYAKNRCKEFDEKYRRKVYNSSFEIYFNISIFFYIRLNKITKNRIKFNLNRIHCNVLKKFSCRLYKEICLDLEKNKIIVINNHYLNDKKHGFSKSFLIHKDIINKINETKRKFKYELTLIEIPEKILKITKWTDTSNSDDDFLTSSKLNRFYRNNNIKNKFNNDSFYSELNFNEKDLDEYCKDDEFLYNHYMKMMKRLNNKPKLVKNRWYHVFHEFPKEFREKVLRFENENIKEIFDISGSDLHMLCKILENKNIPVEELLKFQKEVKNDLRKQFGIRKSDGKCKECVKKSFKVYLNGHNNMYFYFRKNSICRKIDDYFKEEFPNIRQYIVEHENIWADSMKEEFETVSIGMFNELKRMGIVSFTCHDAIYVKKNVYIKNIKEIFYNNLDLLIDRIDKLENL